MDEFQLSKKEDQDCQTDEKSFISLIKNLTNNSSKSKIQIAKQITSNAKSP